MLNIVIPMAGHGSRFVNVGYKTPKPLIKLGDKTMIQVVVENLRPARDHRFIFVCQKQHTLDYGLIDHLREISSGCEVVIIDGVTEGAACTVLEAALHIDNECPLVIANSDQWIDASMDEYLDTWDQVGSDGFIMTMTASDKKWSYIRFDNNGSIVGVVEKEPVSQEATVGIYNYLCGADYCRYAREMVRKNERSKGEFYVAPVYDYMVRAGGRIDIWNIGSDRDGMFGLGTPEDLNEFLSQSTNRSQPYNF